MRRREFLAFAGGAVSAVHPAMVRAQPGRNVTGFTPFEPSLGGKWLELLTEIAPRIGRVGILYNPDSATNA
jgi:ABC-type uncharacterized transport system substrate-binding protein